MGLETEEKGIPSGLTMLVRKQSNIGIVYSDMHKDMGLSPTDSNRFHQASTDSVIPGPAPACLSGWLLLPALDCCCQLLIRPRRPPRDVTSRWHLGVPRRCCGLATTRPCCLTCRRPATTNASVTSARTKPAAAVMSRPHGEWLAPLTPPSAPAGSRHRAAPAQRARATLVGQQAEISAAGARVSAT